MSHKTLNLHRLHECSLRSTAHLLNKKLQNWSLKSQNSNSACSLSPDHVLSKLNKEKCLNLLASSKILNLYKSKNIKKAAVLVPLCQVNDQMAFLYTVRSLSLKLNGGQVAFPGGMAEEYDGTLEATALREANEEVGLIPSKIEVWGKAPEISRGGICVTPVLGYIGHVNPDELKINPDEVSSAFSVSLEDLSNSQKFAITKFRFRNYVYQTPVYLGGKERIWGLTAYCTHIILSALIPVCYNKNIQFQPVMWKNNI